MSVSLIVPLSDPLDAVRAEHWRWLRWRWERVLPASWEVVEGRSTSDPWCKANAVLRAAEQAVHRTWIIIDADVALHPQVLIDAASIVDAGQAAWVHPHRKVYRLAQAPTARLVELDPASDHETLGLPTTLSALEKPPMNGAAGGGCVVVSADAYRQAGGFDPRFTGWSKEDINLGRALTVLVGPPHKLRAGLWHLWHPPQVRLVGRHQKPRPRRIDVEGEALNQRYVAACRDRDAMAALVAEHQGVSL